MFAGDYPPPKYEEIHNTDNSNSTNTDITSISSCPAPLPSLAATNITNTDENVATTTTTTTPFRVNLISSTTPIFGPNPIETDCPYCQAHVVTSIQRIVGALPWIVMGICFLLGFFLLLPWCLCCIPFYLDNCQDVIHSCPSCKRNLGRFTRV
ncbi:LITAF-like protein, putative [Brugia malayi]|uniref:Bm7178 n=1 Tax=Brugia malayi TaxID=6279 RepID=A0A0K0JR86_BRUMA|nr:LITAF-like protein, putative [Brugia malayi]CTP80791.1 Bm7178 [Brugia malayi]VIO95303.1 LITAF-like protein, putative [Brugia malayi]